MEDSTKKTIRLGIIIFIICYIFVQPLLNFIMTGFLSCISKLPSFISDSIYKNAASMDDHRFDGAIFLIIMGFAFSFSITYFLATFFYKKEAFNKLFDPSIVKIRLNIIVIIILIILISLIQCSDYYLNLRFERKIRILGPYLTSQQEKELISKWSMMKSRRDYIQINDSLFNLAYRNNINEPKSLWKK